MARLCLDRRHPVIVAVREHGAIPFIRILEPGVLNHLDWTDLDMLLISNVTDGDKIENEQLLTRLLTLVKGNKSIPLLNVPKTPNTVLRLDQDNCCGTHEEAQKCRELDQTGSNPFKT